MGLAGPSKKRKISHDPRNTAWTNTPNFGHRLLLSQGWAPGTILGPDPLNPHHTSASKVGIKVVLKDDVLGLGCKTGSMEDTCTGLGDLQSLLGRLNGKSEGDIRGEEDARMKIAVEGRYGMRFVRGEVLESTWVTKELKKDVEEEEDSSSTSEEEDKEEVGEDKEQDPKSQRKAEKAARKAERAAKRERKEAKRLRKDEKRRAKAEKKALRDALSSTASTPLIMPSGEPEPVEEKKRKSKSLPGSLHGSGTSTPVNGRHALRSKWIAQKRMAVMDAKALNEILMIKA